jgi:hypothetical protein
MNVKTLLVLIFFGFFVIVVAGEAISATDLTPGTPPDSGSSGVQGILAPAGQGGSAGICGGNYTVRSGDTLSVIARDCSLSLADLVAANPQITNPDLIHVGDQIYIPIGAPPVVNQAPAPQPTVQQAVVQAEATATPPAALLEAALPAADGLAPTVDPIFAAFETARSPEDGSQPPAAAPTQRLTAATGLRPGSMVEVSVAGFPANVPVSVGIGQVGKDPFFIDESITDDQGVARVVVAVPAGALNGQKWTVTIATIERDPPVTSTAEPFVIGP